MIDPVRERLIALNKKRAEEIASGTASLLDGGFVTFRDDELPPMSGAHVFNPDTKQFTAGMRIACCASGCYARLFPFSFFFFTLLFLRARDPRPWNRNHRLDPDTRDSTLNPSPWTLDPQSFTGSRPQPRDPQP